MNELRIDYSRDDAAQRMECLKMAGGDLAKANKLWSFVQGLVSSPASLSAFSHEYDREGQLTPPYEALNRIWHIADGYQNSADLENLNGALIQIREIADIGRAL